MDTPDQAQSVQDNAMPPQASWWDWDRLDWRRWVVLGVSCVVLITATVTLRWTMPYLHGDMAYDLFLAGSNHDVVIHAWSWSFGVRWVYYAIYTICLAAACMARSRLVFVGICLATTACATTTILSSTTPPAYRSLSAACARGDPIMVTMAETADAKIMTFSNTDAGPTYAVTLPMSDGIYMLAHYVPTKTATTALHAAQVLYGASVAWAWPLVEQRERPRP